MSSRTLRSYLAAASQRPSLRLLLALAASLGLHLSTLLPPLFHLPQRSTVSVPLTASLRSSAVPNAAPSAPELRLETPVETPPPSASAAKSGPIPQAKTSANAPAKTENQARPWTQVVRQHLQKLQQQGLFYPAEAIARGWQGEATVLLLLDEQGKVAAARIEESSGHVLLDEAALRAVRSLNTLPADAPRQTLLPVRFRLK